jgi:hypothetical protein
MFKVGIVISVKLAGYVSDAKNADLLLYIVVWLKRVVKMGDVYDFMRL